MNIQKFIPVWQRGEFTKLRDKSFYNKGRVFMKRNGLIYFIAFCLVTTLCFTTNLKVTFAGTRTITCSTADQIHAAFKDAQPGDTINIKAGTYVGDKSKSGYSNGYFYLGANGTSDNPIIVQAESNTNKPILKGTTTSSGYVLYIKGNYLKVKNLKVETGDKAIMLDQSSNNTIYGIEMYNIGQEAIHVRDGSCKNVLDTLNIHDTGVVAPDYGEGVYIGSDKGKWTTYAKECDYNKIKRSTIGPNVAAEHIDIKEGCTGTLVEDNIFNGAGISGANYADSFMDVKGNDTVVQRNQGFRQKNSIIVDAFQVHEVVTGWGQNTTFTDNTVNLDDATSAYVLNSDKVSSTVSNNTRTPAGNMYRGIVVQQ